MPQSPSLVKSPRHNLLLPATQIGTSKKDAFYAFGTEFADKFEEDASGGIRRRCLARGSQKVADDRDSYVRVGGEGPAEGVNL